MPSRRADIYTIWRNSLRDERPELYNLLSDNLEKNIVILEDNSMDMLFDDSLTYDAETEECFFGINLSDTPLIRQAGFGNRFIWVLSRIHLVLILLWTIYGICLMSS